MFRWQRSSALGAVEILLLQFSRVYEPLLIVRHEEVAYT